MTQLLSSVRNLAEAKIALAAGSDWLDLKEPKDGALGAIRPQQIAEITRWANENSLDVPISATIGDFWDQPALIPERVTNISKLDLDYIKIGLFVDQITAGCLRAVRAACRQKIIIVCFAERSISETVIQQLVDSGICGLMLDTAEKSNGSLTEKLSFAEISRFVAITRKHGVLCGLAGSLGVSDVGMLKRLEPDYLGFRGALCATSRQGEISARRVVNIKSALTAEDGSNDICAAG